MSDSEPTGGVVDTPNFRKELEARLSFRSRTDLSGVPTGLVLSVCDDSRRCIDELAPEIRLTFRVDTNGVTIETAEPCTRTFEALATGVDRDGNVLSTFILTYPFNSVVRFPNGKRKNDTGFQLDMDRVMAVIRSSIPVCSQTIVQVWRGVPAGKDSYRFNEASESAGEG